MLEEAIKNLSEFLHHHPNYGQLFAFSIALIESLPIIGTVVPGIITMSLVGSLMGSKTIPLMTTFISTILGALVGDFMGYYLGRKGQNHLQSMPLFKRYQYLFDWGENFFNQYGTVSILIGRFIGPLRSTVPLIAGVLKMPQWLFAVAIIPTATLWALVYLAPGFLLGAYAIDIPHQLVVEYLLYFCFGTLIILMIHKHSKLRSKFEQCLLFWVQPPYQHAIMNITLSCLGLGLISYFVIHNIGIHTINASLYSFVMSLHITLFNKVTVVFSALGDKYSLAAVYIIIMAYFIRLKEYQTIAILAVCGMGSALSIHVIKHSIFFTRPLFAETVIQGPSFPSGHTAAIITLSMLIYSLSPKNRALKNTLILVCFMVMSSRLYLGVHWLSDIVGGIFLGLLFGYIGHYLFKVYEKNLRQPHWIPVYLVAVTLLTATFTQYKTRSYYPELYTPPLPSITDITLSQWQHQLPGSLPYIRKSRFNFPISALNLQYLGSLDSLQQQLSTHGWQIIPSINISSIITAWHNSSAEPPFIQPLYLNQPPIVSLQKNTSTKETHTIKLWKSSYTIANQTLYVGTLSKKTLPYKWMLSEDDVEKRARFNFTNSISDDFNSVLKTLTIPRDTIPSFLDSLNWNGKVLLIKEEKS
ncbi:MAG TPA: bifunctional DedA family/phosphatase PAP2 family protein [Gammaproteobacteria bacterium]|nr:bifunctional DedA family/phosphatase PAP2 family protein [Gammaproteobacteria bacterium]